MTSPEPTPHATHTTDTIGTYLVTGDSENFAELETALITLPLCARGRVFIEVESHKDIVSVTAPSRMTVTWLSRAERSGKPGTCEPCKTGMALYRAVSAWASEMLCDDKNIHVWLTGNPGTAATMSEYLINVHNVSPGAITRAPQKNDACFH